MRGKFLTIAMTAVFIAQAANGFAKADDDTLNDPGVQKTLRAMNDASTWYHPDLFGEFAGVQRYTHHEYAGAMKYFLIGAYYADKLSELSIGLMYLNGEGVAKDPVTAYAWLDLAAEREYPEFVATRDRVKASLNPDELKRAQNVRDQLALRYADKAAKPRMEQQLRLGREQITGSHLGFNQGVKHALAKSISCSGGLVIGGVSMSEAGCAGEDIYAESRWKPEQYFAQRDSQWKATVTVGDITDGGKATETKPAESAAGKPAESDKH
jgi:hypothetical protein